MYKYVSEKMYNYCQYVRNFSFILLTQLRKSLKCLPSVIEIKDSGSDLRSLVGSTILRR